MSDVVCGKPAKAPCGHPGRVVIGAYIECLKAGCDGRKPDFADEEATPTLDRCPKCGSLDVEDFDIYYLGHYKGKHCKPCGAVWHP